MPPESPSVSVSKSSLEWSQVLDPSSGAHQLSQTQVARSQTERNRVNLSHLPHEGPSTVPSFLKSFFFDLGFNRITSIEPIRKSQLPCLRCFIISKSEDTQAVTQSEMLLKWLNSISSDASCWKSTTPTRTPPSTKAWTRRWNWNRRTSDSGQATNGFSNLSWGYSWGRRGRSHDDEWWLINVRRHSSKFWPCSIRLWAPVHPPSA